MSYGNDSLNRKNSDMAVLAKKILEAIKKEYNTIT